MSHLQEPDRLKRHFDAVVKAICDRRVIPFLGAGASVCERPPGVQWTPTESRILPNAKELTGHLASRFNYPKKELKELARVSQYAAITEGLGPLYEELQQIFNKDYQPTSLHHFLAALPAFFREKKIPTSKNQLRQRIVIVTTNYDDLLERAFDEAGEPYHKLVYMADAARYANNEAGPGSFLHWTPDGELSSIEKPNEYVGIEDYKGQQKIEQHPAVIVKIHGAVERDTPRNLYDQSASYVITEDHYIDYLTRTTDIATLLPQSTVAALRNSHFLFLGYSLRDWNLRVIWRRIWRDQQLNYKSWAVQVEPGILDELYWAKQDVDIFNMELADYVRALRQYMENYNV